MNEMFIALGVPLGAFFMAIAIVGLVGYFKNQELQRRHETIRLALEKGQPLPAAVLDPEPAWNGLRGRPGDLARGIQLVFTGAGLSLFLWIFRPGQAFWAVGLIILFVGLGKLVSHAVTGRTPPAQPVA
jgi:hypothetical protein